MTTIYGHDVDLVELDADDGVVLDVIVLARVVRYNNEGHGEDILYTSTTPTTTGMVQRGMIEAARDQHIHSINIEED